MPIPSPIVQYKNHNYRAIQNFLRSGAIPLGETDSSMRAKVQAITDCMQTEPPMPPGRLLYRGTDVLEFGKHSIEGVQKKVGETTYTWKGFVSTSVDENAAYDFIKFGGNGLLLYITPIEGTRFYDMSNASPAQKRMFKYLNKEKEILLDCNTRYRITYIEPAPPSVRRKQYHIVHVQLLLN